MNDGHRHWWAQGRMLNYRWVGDFILLNACNFWIGARKNYIIKYRFFGNIRRLTA
jgi:hypothetical protein